MIHCGPVTLVVEKGLVSRREGGGKHKGTPGHPGLPGHFPGSPGTGRGGARCWAQPPAPSSSSRWSPEEVSASPARVPFAQRAPEDASVTGCCANLCLAIYPRDLSTWRGLRLLLQTLKTRLLLGGRRGVGGPLRRPGGSQPPLPWGRVDGGAGAPAAAAGDRGPSPGENA